MFKEKIIDLKTNKTTFRDYTLEEMAAVEEAQAQAEVERLAAEQTKTEAQAARAKLLNRLGISLDEAKLLLG